MGLQPLLNQGPHSMVEIFASRVYILRKTVGMYLLDLPTDISLPTQT